MTLEIYIEERACLEMQRIDCVVIKMGRDGWPDRLVLYAPGRCLLMEFKQPGGKPNKLQQVRIKQLARARLEVHIVTSWQDAVALVSKARRRDDAEKK